MPSNKPKMNNQEKNENYLLLKLKNAKKRDYGRNTVRIDSQSMQKLNVQTGDILELVGKKLTAGIAFPSYPQDYDLDIIRIDPRMRKNIESEIGEMIKVRKAIVETAKLVVVAPLNVLIRSNPQFESFVKKKLLNMPISMDDTIAISIGISKEILFKVINLEPQGICIINQTTGLTISESFAEKEKEIIRFDMIGGLNEEIQQIKEIVKLHLIQSSVRKEIGLISPKGILLYGIPGTGKTLLVKAIAYESGINFISLNAAEPLGSRTRSMIDQIKYAFEQAKDLKPSIIFIDHIDAIAPNIEKVVGKKEHVICSQLLSLIDGIGSEDDILIIGATNKPEILEPALLRSGRLNYLIELKPPNEKARAEIYQIYMKSIPGGKKISIEELAKKSVGFTGADISETCRKAMKFALERVSPTLLKTEYELDAIDPELLNKILVEQDDFVRAIKYVLYSIRQRDIIFKND